MSEREQPRIRAEGTRCPYCHDALQPEQPKSGCELCLAWAHQECWDAHGGCSACGQVLVAEAAPGPEPVTAAREPTASRSELDPAPRAEPRIAARVASPRRALSPEEANQRFLGGVSIAGGAMCGVMIAAVGAMASSAGASGGVAAVLLVLALAATVLFGVGVRLRSGNR